MNIGIIGAGNIGTYLGAYASLNNENKVWLHTTKPHLFKENLTLIEEEKKLEHKLTLHCITSDLKEVVENSEILFITHPSFMMENTLKEITKYALPNTIIGAIPGFGGKEYHIEKLIQKGCIFFGSQRVPSITRLEKYGECVVLKEKNEFMKIAVVPNKFKEEVSSKITNLIDIPVLPIENYLGITLSPSNPTMHPSRLYELFKDYNNGHIYENHSLFYEEWGDTASSTLLKLDEELKAIFNSLNEFSNFNESDFERISPRFNINSPSELTHKIRTASGFQTIKTPMVKKDNGYIPDLNSRYFIEDIKFGLCIIKSFGELCEVSTPLVDEIISWGQNLLNKEYIINGKLVGKDICELIIPQNISIKDKKGLINYYKNL